MLRSVALLLGVVVALSHAAVWFQPADFGINKICIENHTQNYDDDDGSVAEEYKERSHDNTSSRRRIVVVFQVGQSVSQSEGSKSVYLL